MGEAHPLRRVAGFGVQQRHREPVGHHVEHRDPDIRALAAAPARNQRFEDGGMSGSAGGDIDDGQANARGAVRATRDRGEAALGLDQEIIGLAGGKRALIAIAADRAADQGRMPSAQFSMGKAEPRKRPGLRFCTRISALAIKAPSRARPSGRRQVENDGLLAPVQPDEIARLPFGGVVVAAREIALRPLDLDHPRSRHPRGGSCNKGRRPPARLAVGTPITGRPPHRSVRARFHAYGSHLGCVTANR